MVPIPDDEFHRLVEPRGAEQRDVLSAAFKLGAQRVLSH